MSDKTAWSKLERAGQISAGDRIRFMLGKEPREAIVFEVLAAGTNMEEIVYEPRRNFYFITRMALDGTSSVSNVEVYDEITRLRADLNILVERSKVKDAELERERARADALQARLDEIYASPIRGYLWREGDCRGGSCGGIQIADPGRPTAFGSRTPLIAQPQRDAAPVPASDDEKEVR